MSSRAENETDLATNKLHFFSRSHYALIPLLLSFIILATAWNLNVPAYENLDEIEHTEVIRHIAVTGSLPTHAEAEQAGFHVRQEASQPPLYHLLGAVWVRALGLPLAEPTVEPIPGAVVACGDATTLYNKTTWKRNPYEHFPWTGHRRMVHSLRLLSTLLQTFTVVGTWLLAKRIRLRSSTAFLATSIVAFNPQFLLVAAGVNNDNLVTPLVTWTLVVLLTIWQQEPTIKRLLTFGFLSGLAALSKLSGLALLGLGGLVLLLYAYQQRSHLTKIAGWGLLVGGPALLLLTPWLWRNLQLYGDPTALTPMLALVGKRTSPINLAGETYLMWRSYWGQLPCTFYPSAIYWPFALLAGGGMAGLLLNWQRRPKSQRTALLILCSWFLIVVVAWIRWDMLTPAPGGRLLFPAAPALAVLLATGWKNGLGQLWRHDTLLVKLWAVLLPNWVLLVLLTGPVTIFAPPALQALTTPPTPKYTFGDSVRLQAYEVQLTKPQNAFETANSKPAQSTLDVTLSWFATQPITQDWTVALQLVSATPGDNTLRLSYNYWPGHGNAPTSVWPTGKLLKEHYQIPLPESEFVTQAWDFQVAFFTPDTQTQQRLPVSPSDTDSGNAAYLATMRVPGKAPLCSTEDRIETPVVFGEAIALTHASVEHANTYWQVHSCWEARSSVMEDYTVFAHAYAADETLLGTGDAPPMNRAFPTSYWEPGDQIADEHTIILESGDEQPTTIVIGLYHPKTGTRLPAIHATQRLPNDAAVIWAAP